MSRLRRLSIRGQAAAWGAVLLLAVAAAAAPSYVQWHRTRIETARQSAVSLATASAATFDQYLRGLDAMAAALVLHPSVVALNRVDCDRLFAGILRDQPLILNILLTAPDETIRGSGVPTTNDKPRIAMPYIQQVVTSGRPVVSDLAVGPLTQKPTVILGYPVRSSTGAMTGVLALGLDLAQLQFSFIRSALPAGATVTLTNRSGLVLARSSDADRYIGTTIEVPSLAGPDAQTAAGAQKEAVGVERVVATAEVHPGPWIMSAGVPVGGTAGGGAAPWTPIALAAVGVAGSLLLLLRASNAVSRQLGQLRDAATRMVSGAELPKSAGESLDSEVSQVYDALTTVGHTLRQTRANLEAQIDRERDVRAMLELLQGHIVRQERLAAVGLLLSGVAHELNNPLQAIMGGAELLERRTDFAADVRDEVLLISTQAQRAAEIVRNLSRFGAQRPALPAAIDPRDVISEVVQLRRTDLEAAGIVWEVHTSSTGRVFASFTEIEQVLLNFVINAQQSITSAGVADGLIVIRSSDVDTLVRLEVTDNGPGVHPQDEPKLFQPFFTTKPFGEGTGLGLSVSHKIIESYGGTVGYRRNETGDATFYFELPRLDEPREQA